MAENVDRSPRFEGRETSKQINSINSVESSVSVTETTASRVMIQAIKKSIITMLRWVLGKLQDCERRELLAELVGLNTEP